MFFLYTSIGTPLIKKPGLDAEILKNYRPVSNLSFCLKLLKRSLYLVLFRTLRRCHY